MNRKIDYFKNRLAFLKTKRSEFEIDWRDISKFLSPSTGVFSTDPKSAKDRRRYTYPKDNMNGKPQRYMRDLATSLVATLCPPDSRWFGYRVDNMTADEQSWLYKSSLCVMQKFQANGISSFLTSLFYEAGLYGLGVITEEKSNKTGLDFGKMTCGEYYLAEDFEGNENVLYHPFCMSAEQLKQWFGYDALPQSLKQDLDNGNGFTEYNCVQAVEPNPDYLPAFKNEFNKPFISVVWIEGVSDDECVLEMKGMDDFPFVVFHWYDKTTSVYTQGIGHDIIGDVKELQETEKDTARARKKNIAPPLKADPALRTAGLKTGSNEITYTNIKDGVSPLYTTNFPTGEGVNQSREIDERLAYLTFKNLFSFLMSNPKTRTAEEVKKISQEELIALAGVIQNAMRALSALCERAFKIGLEAGWLPDNMPSSLRGKIMTVSFHSLLAQSMSLSELVLLERWIQFVSVVGAMNPNAARKPDVMKIVDTYAEKLDIDQSLIIPTEDVEKQIQAEAQARAEAERAVQQPVAEKSMSEALKNYADAGETIAGLV